MKKKSTSHSALFNLRTSIGLLVVLSGVFLALLGFGTFSSVLAQNGTTREQMTLALAEALAIQPPACVPGQEMFDDVPASSPFCPFIEELARRGITTGCGGGNYCPSASVSRAQMAAFLVKVLESHTIGNNNTTTGHQALFSNTTGEVNTADGFQALLSNTSGSNNTAVGAQALQNNITGGINTAVGTDALASNTIGDANTATGVAALVSNTIGLFNTAVGTQALQNNITGGDNTAVGAGALGGNTSGTDNIGVGQNAGLFLTTGDNNIDIGNLGAAGEANTIRIGAQGVQTATFIAGISGATVAGGIPVIINASGRLGTIVSSQRFKDEIKLMDKASEAILALKPVTFRYKKELDPQGIPQFGLVAEEVAEVNPDLVVRDAKGEVYTVRYEAVNAMLLNEFLKEHRKVEELEAGMKVLTARLNEQAAQIQKVSAQLEVSKFATGRIRRGGPAPRVVAGN
jgi:hypothetical protein